MITAERHGSGKPNIFRLEYLKVRKHAAGIFEQILGD
jgi:hypothetical protein